MSGKGVAELSCVVARTKLAVRLDSVGYFGRLR